MKWGGLFFNPTGTLYATQVDRGITYTVNIADGTLTPLSMGAFPADSRGDAATCASIAMIPTPVKLTSFTASVTDCNVTVKWVTDEEINSDRFEIQSSTDGITYETIGQVKSQAANSSVKKNYSILVSLSPGTSFLRLKQVDLDGKFEYSKVITTTTNCAVSWDKNIRVFPTLLQTGVIHILFYSDKPHKMNLSLYTVDGKLIRQQQQLTVAGKSKLEMETNYLPKGIYLLKVSGEDGTAITTRINKQ